MLTPRITTIRAADARHPRHSEGAIAVCPDGSLLLVWQEFLASEHGSEDTGPVQLATLRSRDRGESWGDYQVVQQAHPGENSVYSPSLLWLGSGELGLAYLRYRRLKPGEAPLTAASLRRSRDGGVTFGTPATIFCDDARPLTFANSAFRRLASGRLLVITDEQAGQIWTKSDHLRALPLWSDDDGATWQLGQQPIDLPLRGCMEMQVAECRDGRLLMTMRTQLGAVFACYSSDRGETWTKPQSTGLRSPEAASYLARIPQTGDLLLCWNESDYDPGFVSHYGKRTPLTVAVSSDQGATWHHRKQLETDPGWAFSNPALTIAPDCRVYLNYWATAYDAKWRMGGPIDLKLAIFDLEWLYA